MLHCQEVTFICSKNAVLQGGDLNHPSFAVLFGIKAQNAYIQGSCHLSQMLENPQSAYAVKVEKPNGVLVTVEIRKIKFGKLGQNSGIKLQSDILCIYL